MKVSMWSIRNIGHSRRYRFVRSNSVSLSIPCRISVKYVSQAKILFLYNELTESLSTAWMDSLETINPDRCVYQDHTRLFLISRRSPTQAIFPSSSRIFLHLFLATNSLKAKFTTSFFVLHPVIFIPASTNRSSRSILVLTIRPTCFYIHLK